MWRPLGSCTVNATTLAAGLGFLDCPLSDGFLWLRFTTTAPADPVPLGFAVVRPISSSSSGGLPDGRYYPNREPSTVALGPGVGSSFTGPIRLRPRSYNARWLMAGYPARSWSISCEAWTPTSVPVPWFNPSGFLDGVAPLSVSTERVGPAAAAPLSYG